MQIIASYNVSNPANAAMAFSAMLAADKGVSSKLYNFDRGVLVVADDDRGIVFIAG